MKIAICNFDLYEYGGGLTFQKHLYKMFLQQGHRVAILHTGGNNKASRKLKEEGYLVINGISSANLNVFDKLILATTVSKKEGVDVLRSFVGRTVYLVIHDPSQDRLRAEDKMRYLLKNGKNIKVMVKPVFIRTRAMDYYCKKYNLEGIYIKHPYCRDEKKQQEVIKENLVVSTSRIDFDKYVHILIDNMSRIKGRVNIYSGFVNRIYEYHILNGKYNWNRKNYCGKFLDSQRGRIYKNAKIMVDMSVIANDGGGTQYTFLEAMDYGVMIIGNERWITAGNEKLTFDGEEMKKDINFIAVNKENFLEKVNYYLENEQERRKIVAGGYNILEEHSPSKIYKHYLEKVLN